MPRLIRNQVLYCLLYRIPLHLSSNTKVGPNQSRDDPSVIKARIRLVTYSTAVCSLSTAAIVMWLYPHNSPLHLLGYWPIGPVETLKVLLLNTLLFAGPLYECLLIDGVWEEWADGMQPLRLVLSEWTEWRNIVAVCKHRSRETKETCTNRSAGPSDRRVSISIRCSPSTPPLQYESHESCIRHSSRLRSSAPISLL